MKKGRIKNAARITSQKGLNTISELPQEKKLKAIRYGKKFNPEALLAADALHNCVTLRSDPPDTVFDKQMSDKLRDEAWGIICRHYANNWFDGGFLRAMADALDYYMKFPDPVRTRLGLDIVQCTRLGLPMPTISKARDSLKSQGFDVTRKTVERIFKLFEAKPSPDKRGPKIGTKQNSVRQTS